MELQWEPPLQTQVCEHPLEAARFERVLETSGAAALLVEIWHWGRAFRPCSLAPLPALFLCILAVWQVLFLSLPAMVDWRPRTPDPGPGWPPTPCVAEPSDPLASTCPGGHHTHFYVFMWYWALNPGPHALEANTLQTWLPLYPSLRLFKMCFMYVCVCTHVSAVPAETKREHRILQSYKLL